MSREITGHKVNGVNEALTIEADDEPGPGGANHVYVIYAGMKQGDVETWLRFQNGPIKEAGVNGITHEALLAVIIDRLAAFQSGPFACEENGVALEHLNYAVAALHRRTLRRVEAGVEGTHRRDEPHGAKHARAMEAAREPGRISGWHTLALTTARHVSGEARLDGRPLRAARVNVEMAVDRLPLATIELPLSEAVEAVAGNCDVVFSDPSLELVPIEGQPDKALLRWTTTDRMRRSIRVTVKPPDADRERMIQEALAAGPSKPQGGSS